MKPEKKLLPASIVLCSLLGCQHTVAAVKTYCPEPIKPELPLLLEEYCLDSLPNIEIIMQRDDILRLYIEGLEDTILCYKNSQKGVNNEPK